MQICKPHWMRFNRCVNRRDRNFMDVILKWENTFVQRLSDTGKDKYAKTMDLRHSCAGALFPQVTCVFANSQGIKFSCNMYSKG